MLSKLKENTAFTCENCNINILPLTNGSFRNHCPFCLFSKHLDNKPGDRSSNCKGLMRPIEMDYSGKKGFQIVHECKKCGKKQKNKVAKDTIQEDNFIEIMVSQLY